MSDYVLLSDVDIMIAQKVGEHTAQIHDLRARIAANEVQKYEALQSLARRISRIEEHLGITEPAVVPGD